MKRKASTTRSSARYLNPATVAKAVEKRPHYLRCPFSEVILYWLRVMLGTDQCPLFGVERCPLLGGSKCISSMVKSIGGK